MITYSRQELQKLLVSDQALWSRLPNRLSALFWPLEVFLFSWAAGWWIGLLTVALLSILSVVVPPRLGEALFLADLLDRLSRLPLTLGWLLLVWHLTVREPLFELLGWPLAGALAMTTLLWAVSWLVTLGARSATGLALSRMRRHA